MAAFEVIALDTATPQLRAPGAADTYTFPRAVEMPLGTANGVLYLNGSKVVTSGSGLTFDGTNLGIGKTGATPLDMVGTFRWNSNVAGTDIWQRFTGGAGLIYDGTTTATDLAWIRNGAEQMRLTSTGLGIGTSSPGAKLQVTSSGKGSIFGSNSAVNFYSAWQYNSADVGYIGNGASIVAGAAATDFGLTAFTGGKLWLGSNNGASYAVLDSSGNLGLGVTPSAWSQGRAIEVAGTGYGIWNGTASIYSIANAYFDSGFKYANTGAQASHYYQFQGQHVWSTAASGTAGNAISFTQAMTLDASGNLLVGTTSTTIPTASGSLIYLNSPGALYVGHANGAASGTIYSAFAYNGSVIGSITQDGTTAVLYNTTSDQRLKENVQDADPASNLIDAIQVRQFDWKSDGSHQRYGMVAQELAQVAPEAVHQPADPEKMMAVDYSKLVPMLIKEIQSLRARVAALEA